MPIVAALALPLLIWLVADARRAAFALAFTVGTNASGVLEVVHQKSGFLLPLSAAVIVASALRWVAGGYRFEATVATLGGLAVLSFVVLVAAVGPFVSDTPVRSNLAVSLLLKHLVVLGAAIAATRTVAGFRAALYGLAAAGTTLSLLTIYQAITGNRESDLWGFSAWNSELLGNLGSADRAAGPFFDDPNSYAMYLVVALAVAVGLAAAAASGRDRLLLLTAAAAMAVALVSTLSRSGMLAAGVVAVGGAIGARVHPKHLALGAVAIGALLIGPLGAVDRLATLDQVTQAPSDTATEVDSGLRGRSSEMIAAWRMFVDHPITGVGYGAFDAHYLDYTREVGLDGRHEERSAHSLPLEIAAEQGLLGVSAWGLVAVNTVGSVLRLRRRRWPEWLPLALALGGFATMSLFLHDVHPRLMWTLIGLTVSATALAGRARRHGDGHPALAPVAPPMPAADERAHRRLVVAMVLRSDSPVVGPGRQLAALVRPLVDRGIDPVVITRSADGGPASEEIGGARVIRIGVRGPKPVSSLRFAMRARAVLRRIRPDVVHAYSSFTPATIAVFHTRRHGTPVVTNLLRSGTLGDIEQLARKPFGRWRLRWLFDNVDAFVVTNSEIDDELDASGVPPWRRYAIPNGVDTSRFRPRVRPEPLLADVRDGDEVVVVAVGPIVPEKRIAELAARWHALRTGPRPWARLVVVGDGPERERVAAVDGVEVLGWRDDVDAVLRSSDIYVSASAAEDLSNGLLEAMATGLACVVTDVGGVRDLLTGGVGCLVVRDDVDGVVEALAGLVRSARRRGRIGRAARRRVREHPGLDGTAEALAGLYRALCVGAASRDHHRPKEALS